MSEQAWQECFVDAIRRGIHLGEVRMLEEAQSSAIWNREVEVGSTCFFNLSSECWIASPSRLVIGNWVEASNRFGVAGIASLLQSIPDWSGNVIFCKGKYAMLTAPWAVFCESVDCFLEYFDDTPILFSEDYSKAILFESGGALSVVNRSPKCQS